MSTRFVLFAALVLLPQCGAWAALKADYQFQNDLHSSVAGAPDLVALAAGTAFAEATVDGKAGRRVLAFPKGVGLSLSPMSSVLSNTGTYTVEILARIDVVGGYQKYLDFWNGTVEWGLYDKDGALVFYDYPGGFLGVINSTAYADVALTRTAGGQLSGYVNGVLQFQDDDSANARGKTNGSDLWRFFVDDGGGSENSSGAVARIRVWDTALSDTEVRALQAERITFLGLGYLPTSPVQNFSRANAVSADGTVVVGSSNSGATGQQAFRWQGGIMSGLGFLGGGTVSKGLAVSADGATVVGQAVSATTPSYSFKWTQASGMVAADSSDCHGTGPLANGISRDGNVIVGTNDTDHLGMPVNCFPNRPVSWTGGGAGVFLYPTGVPGPPSGQAFGASNTGSVIVGEIGTNVGPQAFRWTSGGQITLGDFGGNNSRAYAVSPDGSVVVGFANAGSGVPQPFRWTQSTGLVAIGGQSNGSASYAVSANGEVVVGEWFGKAFRWSPKDGIEFVQDILVGYGYNLTGWSLQGATGVSADGTVIVGYGASPDGGQAWIALIPKLFSDGFE